MAAAELIGTVTSDRVVYEESRCRQNCHQGQNVHRVFAVQLVAEAVSPSEFRVADVAEDAKQFVHALLKRSKACLGGYQENL